MAEEQTSTVTTKCLCGNVKVDIQGAPKFAGICHCVECRVCSGNPSFHAVVFADDQFNLRAEEGSAEEAVFNYKIDGIQMTKTVCKKCGVELYHSNKFGLFSFGAQSIANAQADGKMPEGYEAKVHIYLKERVVSVIPADGLPKFKDFPAGFGGSDILVNDAGEDIGTAAEAEEAKGGETEESEEDKVKDLINYFFGTWSADGSRQAFTEGGQFIRPSGNPIAGADYIKFVTEKCAPFTLEVQEIQNVSVSGNTAWATLKNREQFVYGENQNDDVCFYTAIAEKQADGQWKLKHVQRSSGQPPAAAAE